MLIPESKRSYYGCFAVSLVGLVGIFRAGIHICSYRSLNDHITGVLRCLWLGWVPCSPVPYIKSILTHERTICCGEKASQNASCFLGWVGLGLGSSSVFIKNICIFYNST